MSTERDHLTSRLLPHMLLSDGSQSSNTPPRGASNAQDRFSLHGCAIITGGAGTLGLQAARALLEHGMDTVHLFDLESAIESAKPAIERINQSFPPMTIDGLPRAPCLYTKPVDITHAEAVEDAIEHANRRGLATRLFCFAGIVGCMPAVDMTAEQWRRTLDVNTTGSFLVAQAFARALIKQGKGGSIVFTASISGHRVNYPQPQVAYNVSKAAILALKSSLAAEWAVHGIRVNSISPGYMDTVLNEGPGLETARQTWCGRNPMGRMGSVGELDGVIVLLASDNASSYITGADFVVDGGQILF